MTASKRRTGCGPGPATALIWPLTRSNQTKSKKKKKARANPQNWATHLAQGWKRERERERDGRESIENVRTPTRILVICETAVEDSVIVSSSGEGASVFSHEAKTREDLLHVIFWYKKWNMFQILYVLEKLRNSPRVRYSIRRGQRVISLYMYLDAILACQKINVSNDISDSAINTQLRRSAFLLLSLAYHPTFRSDASFHEPRSKENLASGIGFSSPREHASIVSVQ